ncbi:MAG: amidohydrolase family protein [Pseudomonadota bacterium]
MTEQVDILIRGGMVADGNGGEPYEADVAIRDGRIVAVGHGLDARGAEEFDAKGLLVTPGFVDLHTHYDAQVTFAESIGSSSWNGVTTALIGNCGVGFAPCRPERREMLIRLMEGVEDLPEVVLTAGIPWNWESFPQFMDALAARRFDLDVAAQVPHSAVRVHVMGQRGAEREDATEADRTEMARLVGEGMRAGALGFATSRAIAHKTLAGEAIPTLGAAEAELAAIADAVRESGQGWLQVISDFDDPDAEFAMLQRVAKRSGRPMTFSLLQRESKPHLWRELLAKVSEANAAGTPMLAQVMGRPVGLMFGFELSQHPFLHRPSFKHIADLPFAARMEHLRDPAFRARILAEQTADPMLRARHENWSRIFKLGDPPEYEPHPDTSVGAEAARRGVDPAALCYEWMMEKDGQAILNRPILNYADGDLGAIGEMLRHPHTVTGLGDGGAHVGYICDASATTHLLTHWTRDRSRGERLPLGFVVKRLTRDNALAVGLTDRGLIAPGHKADINIIDHARLRLHVPEMLYDLPAGGKRLVQRADGYVATILSGTVTFREGVATGALPGRLVRGAQHPA